LIFQSIFSTTQHNSIKLLNFTFRKGTVDDLEELKKLAVKSWEQYRLALTSENQEKFFSGLSETETYRNLLAISHCFLCETAGGQIIGMLFLVPKGNPTEIYDREWCYIRFLTVDPDFGGYGIGRKLATICIGKARQDGEKIIALHTSEIMSKAKHIYESLGFTVLKEIDRRFGLRYWVYKLDLIN